MPYVEVPVPSFAGGLNLKAKPDTVADDEAIDLLNVTFGEQGAVLSRPGYDNFTSSALTNTVASLEPFYRTGSANQLIAGCGTRLEALTVAGGIEASATGLTDGIWDFARFGAPGTQLLYAGQGNQTLRKWDGSSWSAVANTPQGGALAVMAVDQGNRLVVGRFNTTTGGPTGGAATSNPDRVYFSDAGDPETWDADNYVDLTPGDGEKVQAVVAWRERVFVFKETKFFVFYGTSTDAAGNPIFNYQPIDTGVGAIGPRAVTAGRDGVYFVDRKGVYHTTGGDPARLSDKIAPFFLGGTSPFYLGGELSHAQISNLALGYHDERLYLGATTTGTTNNRTLVYDPAYEWWSLYDIPASCFASFRIADQAELVFGYASGSKHVGRHSASYTSDDGVAIRSYWRSGWKDYGITTRKTSRERKIWGSGTISVGVSVDYTFSPYFQETTLDAATMGSASNPKWEAGFWESGTWGATAAYGDALSSTDASGTVLSTYLFNNSTSPWSVHRLTDHMREKEIASQL